MKKSSIVTLIIIIAVIGFAFWVLTGEDGLVDEELAKCIGENSEYYSLKGCPHCENQRRLFGTSYSHIGAIDCFYEREICAEKGIVATPTWIIGEERYEGVQTVESLAELTGCEIPEQNG